MRRAGIGYLAAMLPWLFRRASRRVPWGMVLTVAVWLAQRARERVDANLTHKEQQELLRLVGKSKGRPSNLSQREQARVKNIARKAIRG
jgi:hypothetical protein